MKTKLTNELIRELVNTVRSTKAFVLEHSHDVVKEIHKWGVFENTVMFLFCVLSEILTVLAFIFAYKSCDPRPMADNIGWGLLMLMAVVGFTVALLGCVQFWLEIKRIKIAPKLYILEYLRRWR